MRRREDAEDEGMRRAREHAQRVSLGELIRDTARLLSACDLLVDGPYLEAQRSEERWWIGSRNQGLHFLSGFYDPADPRFRERNTIELRLDGERLLVNGWPLEGIELVRRRES